MQPRPTAQDPPVGTAPSNSLGDFLERQGVSFDDRFDSFAPFATDLRQAGVVLREITGPTGAWVTVRDTSGQTNRLLMLGSNDYLGLATEPSVIEAAADALRRYGAGCGGPPLLNGTTSLHCELEHRLAAFKGCEDAMVFSSGYAANVGWVTGLLAPGDVLIYDDQSHASLIDGIRMGRTRAIPVAHNDVVAFEHALATIRKSRPTANVVVSTHGVFSMAGDTAPLPELRALCENYDALLALDDAHGTGVLGADGRGTPEHFGLEGGVDLVMASFSKVFAATGGFLAGSARLIEYLRYFARSYMFSAAIPPSVAAGVLAGIDFIERHPERLVQLRENVQGLVAGLRAAGFAVEDRETGIIPLYVPGHVSIRAAVARLHEEGVFVNGVEYPAVPKDRQRLRLSVKATMTRQDIEYATTKLAEVGAELGFLRSTDQRTE